jgi:regulatory LacI family protein
MISGSKTPPGGQQMVAGERPPLVDVAAASGVTVSIVSRVLNGDPTVSTRPETRKRIIQAVAKLSYTWKGASTDSSSPAQRVTKNGQKNRAFPFRWWCM